MKIEQIYTGCLAQGAYYIESNGEAAVIDPLREVEPYIQKAERNHAKIKYVFETHFHADFVSGHLDLSKKTGAPIVYGPTAKPGFDAIIATDAQEFKLGKATIKVIHTPGHTMESSCFLLKDEKGKDVGLFSGDTLFIGDVGRPDLAQKGEELTMEDLAGMLYESLQKKILPLADDVIVYPGHGPGSACGKNLGPYTYSTIGEEKQTNYALKATNRKDFIHAVTEGLTPPPQYFPINAKINREGYESLDKVLDKSLKPLSIEEVKKAIEDDVLILDTRNENVFTDGFIPGSISIGLEGRFAEWAGSLLSFDQPMLIVTELDKEKEAIIRLARVGFSNVVGYVAGGFEAWKSAGEEIDLIINVEADELAMDIPFDENLVVLDVRKPTEFAEGHVKNAVSLPLNEMMNPLNLSDLDEQQNIYVHCQGGYRSIIASSLLKRQGFHNIRNIVGGYNKIIEQKKIQTEKESSVLN